MEKVNAAWPRYLVAWALFAVVGLGLRFATRSDFLQGMGIALVFFAGVGLLVGLGVAYGGVQLLLSLGASKLPRLDSVPFDASVFGFAVAATVIASLIVGFAPALRLASTDVRTLMNETGRSGGAGKATARWLNVMTVAQIALAITLVAEFGNPPRAT